MNPFSVVIPSRNAANLVPCVKAIREAGETCRIIVVDDGLSFVGDHFYFDVRVIIVKGESPFIFARNVNIGIRAAGTDDVILLNDDALLKTPMGFTKLQEAAYYGDYGIVASTCSNVGNPNQFARKVPRGVVMESRMVCFVCVYIPRITIMDIGLLDERFVDYGLDDDDYCLRVRKAGTQIGVDTGVFVDHGSLNSSFRGQAGRGGNFHPNMKRFIEKWGMDNWGKYRAHSQFAALFPPPEAPQ